MLALRMSCDVIVTKVSFLIFIHPLNYSNPPFINIYGNFHPPPLIIPPPPIIRYSRVIDIVTKRLIYQKVKYFLDSAGNHEVASNSQLSDLTILQHGSVLIICHHQSFR